MTEISGHIWNGEDFDEGSIIIEDGIVVDIMYGQPTSDENYTIIPGLVDGHTHIADAGLVLLSLIHI